MSAIRLLDKSVFELIAAGEVIERPSSVVKELLENSIDAKATSIEIEIKNGGKSKIRITDNGIGMSFEDCKTAFYRHATSKVSVQKDLDNIQTLGFRGEALASICAVARVELLSKQKDSDFGTRYLIAGGEEILHEEAGTPDGTTIIIEDLFFNVPARLKFLKKDSTEGTAIADIVEKIAISHPEISITFKKDGKIALQTPGNGKLIDSIYAVYGKHFSKNLIEISYDMEGISVSGYISKPMECRQNRSMQHCFINGRYVKSKTCVVALEEGYKGSVMIGRFPACVLFLSVPPNTIDVNVHPAKIEVRFSNEQTILQAVYTAVKQAINKNSSPSQHANMYSNKPERKINTSNQNITPPEQIHFSMRSPSIAYSNSSNFSSPMSSTAHKKNEDNLQKSNSDVTSRIVLEDAEAVWKYDKQQEQEQKQEKKVNISVKPDESDFKTLEIKNEHINTKKVTVESELNLKPNADKEISIKIIGELFETYVLAESDNTFYLMDKHAAHERIIYENIRCLSDDLPRQTLLAPISVNLSKAEYDVALSNKDILSKFGFCVEDFGKNSVLLSEIPMILDAKDCREVLLELLTNILQQKRELSPSALDDIYHTMACKAAIKANDKNSLEELKKLFFEAFFNDNIRYCPHGRPTFLSYSKERIEKQFGR